MQTPPPQTPYSPRPFPAPGQPPAGQAPWQAPGMPPQVPGMPPQVPPAGAIPPWTGSAGAVGAPGVVGAPGFGHPGIAQPGQGSLHAYRPGHRNPARGEVPPRVVSALRVMWIGLGATVINVIVSILAVVSLDNIATSHPIADEQNAAYSAERVTQNERASRIFSDVIAPILSLAAKEIPDDVACDGIAL